MKHKSITLHSTWLISLLALIISCSLRAQSPLQLVEPTYDCYSGFITFNITGGDESLITFVATGASLTSAGSNTGIVDEKWRIDPSTGPILIRATQSGITVNYSFDVQAQCTSPSFIKSLIPVVISPISDLTAVVGESLIPIDIDDHFTTRSHGYDYRTRFSYTAYGLPPGMVLSTVPGLPPGYAYVTGTPTTEGIYNVLIVATSEQGFNGAYSVGDLFQITVKDNQLPVRPLAFAPPTYDCQTGAFQFITTGGDGSPIEYYAVPGITGWTTNPNQFVDRETRTAADAQPITLRARQSNQEVSYVWDIRAQCPTGNLGNLRLIAPQYDCASGAFTFQTTGGEGSPVEFMAIGITGWTMNPHQFVDKETRTAADAPFIVLRARQNGREFSYEWNIRAVCPLGSYRQGAGSELHSELEVRVLGNPTSSETVQAEVRGAMNQALHVKIIDEQGRLVSQKVVSQASAQERIALPTGTSAGIYLLQVTTPTQQQTVKVIK